MAYKKKPKKKRPKAENFWSQDKSKKHHVSGLDVWYMK